jgi:hypothetical protein
MGIGWEVARLGMSAAQGASKQAANRPPVQRPVGMMSFDRAITPEGRAEFASIWKRPKAGATVAVPERAVVTGQVRPRGFVPPEEVADLATTLNQGYAYLGHMAHWSSQAVQITAALFAAASHARDPETKLLVFNYFPHLWFTGRTGGCGKSWQARLTASLCPDPQRLGEMTKASLVDLFAQHHTVVITEMEKVVGTSGKRAPWLAPIINLAFEFDGKTSRKQGGAVQIIPLFTPLILDGKYCMAETTGDELTTALSRCLELWCVPGPEINGEAYRPPRYDRHMRDVATEISSRFAARMALEVKDGIGDHVPDVPKDLGNRPFTLWEPLFTVAERAGGHWPAAARYACEYLESPAEQQSHSTVASAVDGILGSWEAAGPELPEVNDNPEGNE